METIYNVDYFIKKFEAIPEHKFCTHNFINNLGQRCFIGHTMPEDIIYKVLSAGHNLDGVSNYRFTDHELQTEMAESKAISDILKEWALYIGEHDQRCLGTSFAYQVNNGRHPDYQEPTIKGRILAVLRDIKAHQQPKEKVIYKTVVIDSVVKELQETLTEN